MVLNELFSFINDIEILILIIRRATNDAVKLLQLRDKAHIKCTVGIMNDDSLVDMKQLM